MPLAITLLLTGNMASGKEQRQTVRKEGVTSCTMLPHSVSQACSTSGDPTCSRHLSPDLLEGAGGTGGT